MGSGFAGYAMWMLDPHTIERQAAPDEWIRDALTLFALAARANSRQDVASLHRDVLAARIVAAHGREALGAAEAEVASLSPADAVSRGLELLSAARA